tara:strand:- start:23 stop:214 length:192 start_codon:yes stop_codon:yes gene_type:complete
MKGQNFTNTMTLDPNQVCEAFIDGSKFIAHAMFFADSSTNEDSEVGIMYQGVKPGEFLEVAAG